MTVTGFAPAKINLYLHVAAPRSDGLHPLDSLVIFADVGDVVDASAGDGLTLEVSGPFAAALAHEPDNHVLRAARALGAHAGIAPRAALTLDKRLPIASGIGGGSSDAAATLRVLNRLWRVNASDDDLEKIARTLGADVPVCVRAQTARMQGIGEVLASIVAPSFDAVLVNPLHCVPTGEVYGATIWRKRRSRWRASSARFWRSWPAADRPRPLCACRAAAPRALRLSKAQTLQR